MKKIRNLKKTKKKKENYYENNNLKKNKKKKQDWKARIYYVLAQIFIGSLLPPHTPAPQTG